MRARIALALLSSAIAIVLAAFASTAAAAISPNPWLENRFLHIAHQGGEDEAPSSTMYALRSAMREADADMLEIDVQLTADGHLVVIHDDTFTRTGCLPSLCDGADPPRSEAQIRDMTLAEVQALDAGYWFRPGSYSHDFGLPDSAYPFRGIRTGQKAPPKGYTAEDFRIPTLREVLDAFPATPFNIEIKMPKSQDPAHPYPEDCGTTDGEGASQLCDDLDLARPTTQALASLLNTYRPPPKLVKCKVKGKKKGKGKRSAAAAKKPKKPKKKCKRKRPRQDMIVVSFAQEPMVEFAALAPQIHRAPSEPSLTAYALEDQPLAPDPAAFQVPPRFGPLNVPQFLLGPKDAHGNGYAVHVFTDGDQDETPESYAGLIALGVDGIMTSRPRTLDAYLCSAGIPHPDGSSRCDTKAKKKKKKKRKKKKRKKR